MPAATNPIQSDEENTIQPGEAGDVAPQSEAQRADDTTASKDVEKLHKENAKWRNQYQELKAKLDAVDKANKEKADAEAATMAEQGKWKEIAEKAQAQLKELTAAVSDTARYKGALEKMLEAQRDGLPEPITKLLDKLDPVEQLEWIAENKPAVTAPPQKQAAPNLTGFNPQGGGGQQETDRQRIARLAKQQGQASTIF